MLYTVISFAQTYTLKAHYNIRSSPDFLSGANVVGSLPAGSVIQVLEKKRLPSGAYGLRIEIVSSKNSRQKINSNQKWIYKMNEAHYSEVKDASNPFAEKNRTIKKNIETEAVSEATCEDCLKKPAAMPALQNHNDLGSITQSVERSNNEVVPSDSSEQKWRQQVKNYSEGAEVKASINYAVKHYSWTRSRSKCYKAVKLALTASPAGRGQGLIPAHFDDEAALNAQFTLKDNYGFVNLMMDPTFKNEIKSATDAPKGSVLVYSSGKKCRRSKIEDCGHVEIKTDRGYVSDFFSKTPISDDPEYILVGVMIKPMIKGN